MSNHCHWHPPSCTVGETLQPQAYMPTGSVPTAVGRPARACVLSLVHMAGPFSSVPAPCCPGCQHQPPLLCTHLWQPQEGTLTVRALTAAIVPTAGPGPSPQHHMCICTSPCQCTDTCSWPCSSVCVHQPLWSPQLLPWSLATGPRAAAEDTLPSQSFLLADLRVLGA